jgi:hypothetical protein
MTLSLRTPLVVSSLLCIFLVSACSGAGGNNASSGGDGELSCTQAVDNEGEAFLKLDQSCTTAEDCTVIERGSCGCPLPVSKSATIDAYQATRTDVMKACGDSVTANCEALGCSLEVDTTTVICNAQNRCAEPESTN